jgi:hypothetical protein
MRKYIIFTGDAFIANPIIEINLLGEELLIISSKSPLRYRS